MDWENEPYVKVYTRETDDDLVLSWEALALWRAMLLRLDRSGRLDTRRGARGLAAIVRIPLSVVERVLPELLADGRVRETHDGYLAPDFMASQEAKKSDKLRQREARERRRQRGLSCEVANKSVTPRDAGVTDRDQTSREFDDAGENVTLCSADPDPLQRVAPAGARAIPQAQAQPSPQEAAQGPAADPPAPRAHAEDPALLERRRLNERTLRRLEEIRARVAGQLRQQYRPLPAFTGRELAERIREDMVVAGHDLARVEADLAHVLAVREAEALAQGTIQWLTGAIFDERSWRRALGQTLADARRQPPRPVAPSEPLRLVARPEDDMPPLRYHETGRRPT